MRGITCDAGLQLDMVACYMNEQRIEYYLVKGHQLCRAKTESGIVMTEHIESLCQGCQAGSNMFSTHIHTH